MAFYLLQLGHDVTLNNTHVIVPQPRSPGVQVVTRSVGVSMVRHETGLWIPLRWNVLNVTHYQALIEAFGLETALEADVSVSVPDFQYDFRFYNGTAIRPEQGQDIRRDGHFLKDITILIVNLVEQS